MKLLLIVICVVAMAAQNAAAQPKRLSRADLLHVAEFDSLIGRSIGDLMASIELEHKTVFPFSRRPDKPKIHVDGFVLVYPYTDSTDIRVQVSVDSLKYVKKGDRQAYNLDLIAKEKISSLGVVVHRRMTDNDLLFYNEFLQSPDSQNVKGR